MSDLLHKESSRSNPPERTTPPSAVGGPRACPWRDQTHASSRGDPCTPRVPGRMTGFQSGTADRRPAKGRSSDGVEPGHTPRPKGRSKGAHAVEFSKTVAPLGEGIPSHGASRTVPIPERTDEYSARTAKLGGLGPRTSLWHRLAPNAFRVVGPPRSAFGDSSAPALAARGWWRRLRDDLDRHRPLAGTVVEVDQH